MIPLLNMTRPKKSAPTCVARQVQQRQGFIKIQRVSKHKVFKLTSLSLKARHFGTRLVWCPFGCLFKGTQRGIKTEECQKGRSSELSKIGILMPVWFGIYLGSSKGSPHYV